jgi:RNA polymerase sigma-70 factor (ECF subfamily)
MSVSGSDDSTSLSLLNRIRTSDAESWSQFCRLYAPLVYAWARSAGLQDDDAADVGQEVFRTVAVRIGEFQRSDRCGSFRRWLWLITRNKLGDHFRRMAAQPQATGGSTAQKRLSQLPDDPATDSGSEIIPSESASVVRRALDLIRGDFELATWQAFWRATVDGDATDEIAHDLRMTPNAVRQAKFRVLRKLRQELNGLLD